MKVTVIEARNFLSHAASRVEFNGDRLSTFAGSNGAGKSALLEALSYVLYDDARGRTDDLVRIGTSEMSATVEFEFGEETYRVSRGRSTRAGGKSFLELHILDTRPDVMDWRPLTADSMRDTQALIAELLRLDADTFATAAFLKQGEADRFISATAGDRKRILSSVLGLDRYERAEARARELARDLEAKTEADRRAVDALTEKIADRQQHAAAEAHYRHAIEEAEIEAGLVEIELAEHRTALSGLAEKLAAAAAAEADLTRLTGELTALGERHVAAANRASTAAEQLARADATLAQEARIREAIDALPRLNERVAAAKAATDAHAAAKADRDAAERALDAAVRSFERIRDGAQHDLAACEQRVVALREQLNDTTTCPECGAEIPAGGVGLNVRIRNAEDDVVGAKSDLARASKEPASLVELRAALERHVVPDPPTDDAWQLGEQLRETQALAAGLASIEEAHRIRDEAAAAIAAAGRERDAVTKQIGKTRRAHQGAAGQVNAAEPLRAEHQGHVDEVARLEGRGGAIADEVRAAERLHATAVARLEALSQAETERDAIAGRIEAAAAETVLLRRLVVAFGANGIPARIIEGVLPELGRYANELLEQLRPGMSLELRAQRAKRDGGMAEALDLVVRDDVGERGLALFSGGERMSVALAIAVGLSRLVARRAGTAIRTLVVDEPDGLDVDARRAFGAALRILAHHGELERVLLVSHHEDLAEIGDAIYRVSKDATGSHVELVS